MATETLLNIAVVGLLSFTILFTFLIGGRLEKYGAAIFALGTIGTWTVQTTANSQFSLVGFMLVDFTQAAAFASLIVLDKRKLWPGAATCAQLLVFVFSATRAVNFPLSDFALLIMLNVCAVAVELTLILGACAHRWNWGRADDVDFEFAA